MSTEPRTHRITQRRAAYQVASALYRHGFDATEDRILEEIAAAVNEPVARKFSTRAWRSWKRFVRLVARELDDMHAEAEIHARLSDKSL